MVYVGNLPRPVSMGGHRIVENIFGCVGDIYLIRFLDVLSGIPPKTCASIAPNTGMRKRRGRQRDTATGIGDSVSLETDESTLGYE